MKLLHSSQLTPNNKAEIDAASDRAAGALIISKSSGNILIAKRSSEVEHPNKMGIFGGRFDDFETPEEALEREIFEETGYPIFGQYKPLCIFHSPDDDFAYHTQIAFSPDDFEVNLNWEHTESMWISLEDLKTIPVDKLHHGIASLLENDAVINELHSITQHYALKDPSVEQERSHSY